MISRSTEPAILHRLPQRDHHPETSAESAGSLGSLAFWNVSRAA
jgi:hypothetical protein